MKLIYYKRLLFLYINGKTNLIKVIINNLFAIRLKEYI